MAAQILNAEAKARHDVLDEGDECRQEETRAAEHPAGGQCVWRGEVARLGNLTVKEACL